MDAATQGERARAFHDAHHADRPLVLPNAWDAVSALVFERAGHVAVGTSSSAIAASFGHPTARDLGLEPMLEVVERLASTLAIPLSADMEAGYAEDPADVATTVTRTVEAGAVGVNLEDGGGWGTGALTPTEDHAAVVAAASEAADAFDFPVVVNARTDVFWLDVGDDATKVERAVERGNAYLDAGADCVFVPGASEREAVRGLVEGLDGPLNVTGNPRALPIPDLGDLGVARVSVGSGPMRSTLGHLRTVAEDLAGDGTFRSMADAIPYGEWNAMLDEAARAREEERGA